MLVNVLVYVMCYKLVMVRSSTFLAFIQILMKALLPLVFFIFGYRSINSKSNHMSSSVIISNHISKVDPFAIMYSLSWRNFLRIFPVRFVAANKYISKPIQGRIIMTLGAFPAFRHDRFSYGIQAARGYLSRGDSIMIFPEGQRVNEKLNKIRGSPKRLRTGASIIAKGYQVIPVLMKDNGYRKYVIQGKPFKADNMTIEQMMERVWELEELIK